MHFDQGHRLIQSNRVDVMFLEQDREDLKHVRIARIRYYTRCIS